jgi:hypothetical protein
MLYILGEKEREREQLVKKFGLIYFLGNKRNEPGANVMTANLSDFGQFSAEKNDIFHKASVMIQFLPSLALCLIQSANFFANFWRNVFKIL